MALLTAGAALLAGVSARSQPPTPASSSAASVATSAAASATTSAAASALPAAELPLLRGAEIPAEVSEAPAVKEWEGARQVRPNRESKAPCTFRVLREWLRMECEHRIGTSLVAGDPTDVKLWSTGDPSAEIGDPAPSQPKPKTAMMMRLRRGDTKIFELAELSWNYSAIWADPAERLAVMWREGREDPVMIIAR